MPSYRSRPPRTWPVRRISIPDGSGSNGIGISPDGSTVYALPVVQGDGGPGVIARISTATDTYSSGFQVNASNVLSDIAVSPDGSHAYVSSFNTVGLLPVDLDTDAVGTQITTSAQVEALQYSPDGSTVWAAVGYARVRRCSRWTWPRARSPTRSRSPGTVRPTSS